MMDEDPQIVREVRARAEKISAEHGHDLRRYAARLRSIESRYPGRVVDQMTVVKRSHPQGSNGTAA